MKKMQQIMQKFMLSCEEITLLMEKKQEQKLSVGERMELFFHTMMCDACKQYEKQSYLLEEFFKARKDNTPQVDLGSKTKKLEEKILQELNQNPDKHDDR